MAKKLELAERAKGALREGRKDTWLENNVLNNYSDAKRKENKTTTTISRDSQSYFPNAVEFAVTSPDKRGDYILKNRQGVPDNAIGSVKWNEKRPLDRENDTISNYTPANYNISREEYSNLKTIEPSLPEFGSYNYFKRREETLRPIVDEIANDSDRMDNTISGWVENYRNGTLLNNNPGFLKIVEEYDRKFKYQDAIIAEYEDIDNQLSRFSQKGVTYTDDNDIYVGDKKDDAKYSANRKYRLAWSTPMTQDQMILGYAGNADESDQEVYNNVQKIFHKGDIDYEVAKAYDYYEENKDNKYGNNPIGRWQVNSERGRIAEKEASAGYISFVGKSDNIDAADIYQHLYKRITENNQKPLKNKNGIEKFWAEVAQYSPQAVSQMKRGIPARIIGFGFGLMASGGNIKAASTAGSAASSAAVAKYMYEQTSGSTYVKLLRDSDLSTEDAAILSRNEALASSAIEFGLGFASDMLWVRAGTNGKGVVKSVGKDSTKNLIKKLTSIGISEKGAKIIVNTAKTAGKTTLDSFGEGLEEWMQEGVSITTEKHAAKGETVSTFELLVDSLDFSKYSKGDLERMDQSFLSGVIIGIGSSGSSAASSYTMNKTVSKMIDAVDTFALGVEAQNGDNADLVLKAITIAKNSSDASIIAAGLRVQNEINQGKTPRAVDLGTIIKNAFKNNTNMTDNSYPHAYDTGKADKSFINAVDGGMMDFIDNAVSNLSDNKSIYVMGKTSDNLNKKIMELTGIDTTSFNHYIKANSIRHIVKDHGINGEADNSLANKEDIARMGYVIENFDDISLLDTYSKEYRDKNQSPAPIIKLSKRVDGTYYVVEAVPDTKAKSLAVVSAYIEKAPKQQTENVQAFSSNVQNGSADNDTSNVIVAEENKIVNTSDETKYLLKSLSDDAVGVYGRVSEIEGQNGVDSGTVLRNFNRFYLGGLRGESFLKLSARYGDRISYQSKKLAYEQGIAEAKQNEKNRVTDSKKAKVYEGGLENREALLGVEGIDKKQLDLIDRVSRILGVKVRISDIVKNSKGKEVNAKVSDGVIEISKKAVMGEDSKGGALRFLFNHEITHRIGELAPKQYRKFCDIALDYASLKTGLSVNELIDRYSNERGANGEDLNIFELMDEISADVAGMDIFSSDLIEYAARENIGVFEKMKNLLFDVLDKLGIAKYSEVDKLKRTWQKAFDKAKRQAEINSRNVDLQEDSGVERYSVDKRKKSLYNEYMTNAMIWAKSTDRQLGDLKILNANGKNFALIEATEDGFVEIKRGTYKEVQARYERVHREKDRSFHAYTEEIRSKQDRNMWDMQYAGDRGYATRYGEQTGRKGLQNNTSRNNEYLRTGDKGKHSSGKINPFESESLNYEGKNNVDNILKNDIITNKKQMFGDDVKQLNNVVMQSQIKAKDKLGYLPPTGYAYTNNYFVAFKNKGAGDYKFEMAIWVDGNEDFIDYLQEAINNGRIKQSTRNFTSIVNDFRRGNGSDNRNNVIIEKGRTSSSNDRLSGREQGSDTERYIGGNDKDSKGRYSSGKINPFGKNGGQTTGVKKSRSYSNKNTFWYPDLPKRKLEILKQRIKSDIKRSKNTITDTANWMFTDIEETDVFAIYSTENFDEPTLLYESKGKKAENERNELLKILEDCEYGRNDDGQSKAVNTILGSNWMQDEYNMANSGDGFRHIGRESNTGDDAVLQGQSSTYGSRAFKNVVKNLFEIQEGGRYSSGEIDPFGKNGGQNVNSKKTQISYSNKNKKNSFYWYPDLPKRKLDILKQRIKSDIKRSKNTITDMANWMFTDIDDTDVFAIYSTENFDEPTLLYESKGKKAEKERSILLDLLEVVEYGKNTDGKSRIIGRVSGGNWMQNEYNMADSGYGLLGRNGNTGNATILQRQSSTRGSRAFENVIKNLVEIQEGGRYSSGEIDPFGKIAKDLEVLNEAYGTIEKGEKPMRDVNIPKQISDDRYTQRFARTVIESDKITDKQAESILEAVRDGVYTYSKISDEKAWNAAKKRYEEWGHKDCLEQWDIAMKKPDALSKYDIAFGEYLLEQAAKDNDIERVMKLTAEIAAEGTRAGQVVQAMRLLKNMDGAGQLVYIERITKGMQEDLYKRLGKKAPEINVSEDLKKKLIEARGQEEIDNAVDEIISHVAEQMPSTWADKWTAWRYFAMLGNTRTHIRNITGNAVFMPAIAVKNVIATGIEMGVNKVSKVRGNSGIERTKTIGVPKKYKDFAVSDYETVKDIISSGGKHNVESLIDERRTIFKFDGNSKLAKFGSKMLIPIEYMKNLNSSLLEREDGVFLKHHYVTALSRYLSANKIDIDTLNLNNKDGFKVLEKAREVAIKEAQKATYRDASALANTLKNISNKNPVAKVIVEGAIPFKKTPVNIVKRATEYSPVGLIDTLARGSHQLKTGKITVNEFIDKIAAGLSGTGLTILGAALANWGFLRGSSKDDEEEFEELMGSQAYSLVFGDKKQYSYTVDWTAPGALPLFVGVELNRLMESNEDMSIDMLFDSATTLVEPILELSMLDGIERTLKAPSYHPNDKAITAICKELITSYFGQGVPTALGQITRTFFDDVRRTTFVDKESGVPEWLQYPLQSQMNKIPGLSKQQEPYVDEWGRVSKTENILERGFENFISPGYFNESESSKMEKELIRLSQKTGLNLYPGKAEKSINIDGQKKTLSAKEYTEYQKTVGKAKYDLLTEITSSKEYKKLSDGERADIIDKAYDLATQKTKMELYSGYNPDTWVKEAIDAEKDLGLNSSEYLIKYLKYGKSIYSDDAKDAHKNGYDIDTVIDFKNSIKDFESDKDSDGKEIWGSKQKKVLGVINDMDISDDEKLYLYSTQYDTDDYDKISVYVDSSDYLEFLEKTVTLTADKDENGKSISGSKQDKVIGVIDNMNLSSREKAYLYNTLYKETNNPWRSYLN